MAIGIGVLPQSRSSPTTHELRNPIDDRERGDGGSTVIDQRQRYAKAPAWLQGVQENALGGRSPLALFRHDERPPRGSGGAEQRMPVPRRNVWPTLSLLVADQFTHQHALIATAGAEAAHRLTIAVPSRRQGGDAVAAGAEAVDGCMQTPRRRVDPAHDDFAPSIPKAADATGELLRKGALARCQRQFLQWMAVVVDRPARKADGQGAAPTSRLLLQRHHGRCNRDDKKG